MSWRNLQLLRYFFNDFVYRPHHVHSILLQMEWHGLSVDVAMMQLYYCDNLFVFVIPSVAHLSRQACENNVTIKPAWLRMEEYLQYCMGVVHSHV